MVRQLTHLLVIVAIVATASAAFAAKTRSLDGVKIDADKTTVSVRLDMAGNNGQALGKVYYTGDMIRIVVANAKLSGKSVQRIDGDDDLLKQVVLRQKGNTVWLYLRLTEKVSSIMERIVFEPGLSTSVITLRKEAYYSPARFEAEAPVAPVVDEPEVIEDSLPLVAPDAMAAPLVAKVEPTPAEAPAAAATDDVAAKPAAEPEVVKRREQVLAEILDEQPAKAEAGETAAATSDNAAAAAPEAEAAEGDAPIPGIGLHAPDLTNLYIMVVVVVLMAALWFGFARRRRFGLGIHDEPLKVVKTQALGGKQRLLVVEAEGKRLLLSSSDKGVSLLTELDPSGSADHALASAAREEKVRYLFNEDTDSVPTPAPATPRSSRDSRTSRPNYFGSGGGSNPFRNKPSATTAAEEGGLREQLRKLRKRG